MPLPKKKQMQERVQIAIETAETDTRTTKKLGRKPLAGNRPKRITAYLTEETFKRFNLGYMKTQIAATEAGEDIRIDKSLIIEDALKTWLDNHGF